MALNRVVALTLLASAAVLFVAAAGIIAHAQSAKKVFKPGASITANFYFTIPANYSFGEDPLAGIIFDKEKLKKLPVKITPLTYAWKSDALGVKPTSTGGEKTTIAAKVKIKLKPNSPVGELVIPLAIEVHYCNVKDGWCSSSTIVDKPIKLTVSKAKGALSKGSQDFTVNVNPDS